MCPVRLGGVCAYPKKLEEVAAYNTGVVMPRTWAHESRRTVIRIVPPVEGLWPVFVHTDCICNELISATNRVLGVVPQPTAQGLKLLRQEARLIAKKLGRVKVLTTEEFVNSFTGRRRRRYELAVESLQENALRRSDGNIKAFVKAEKFSPFDKENPDPRMIQARNARYNVEVGVYLKAMEHRLYKLKGPTGMRCIAKGMNMDKRAKVLLKKLAQFDDPICYSLDGSRWDKHISESVLAIEHSVYETMCPDPYFSMLLSWQRNNLCFTTKGLKYRVRGNRMSGDMNTALGNCLLMCIMVHAFAKYACLKKWDLFDDGDDCLLIVERRDEWRLKTLSEVFLMFGQEVKLENRADRPEDILFCQTKCLVLSEGPRMVRNWRKVLSQGCAGYLRWSEPKQIRAMMGAVGMCELALNRGVPILQEYSLACIRNSRGAGMPKGFFDEAYRHVDLSKAKPSEITPDNRHSFMAAFGITPDEQVAIERELSGWNLTSVELEERPAELDYRWSLDVDPSDPLCWLCRSWPYSAPRPW